jgi:cell division inhibitor SulA
MGTPRRRAAFVVDVEHRDVGHEAIRRGSVPVILAWFEEHTVARADHLDRAAAPLGEADALEQEDGLAVRVSVPAVRAPGVKWTLLALTREEPDGVATASM